MMSRVIEAYFHLLKGLIALCLAIMVVLVFGNVVLRYGFNTGITISEEVSRWLFVYLTFLGAIVALREHGHLGVDSLVARLPVAGKKFCLIASQLLMIGVCYLFLTGSWEQMMINMGVTAPASGASVGIFYAVGVIFSVSALAILGYELFMVVSGRVSDADLVMVKESEEQEELEELQKQLKEQERLEREGAAASATPGKPN